ncbi:MAG: TetR/AcrR family transcriptional regulator [Acidimicrobiales bacterium]
MVSYSRPLRSDARHNRERLVEAASALFAEVGLDAPLETIARTAGVSVGTLYNRFPTREQLLDAVFVDRMENVVALVEIALADEDPWRGLVGYLTSLCGLQSADRGFNDLAARGFAGPPAVDALHRAARGRIAELIDRAKRVGMLRRDLAVRRSCLRGLGISRTIELTSDTAPDAWRRHLGLLVDGFRADAAHPLPVAPMRPYRTATMST